MEVVINSTGKTAPAKQTAKSNVKGKQHEPEPQKQQ
jgi:hypothetical protein